MPMLGVHKALIGTTKEKEWPDNSNVKRTRNIDLKSIMILIFPILLASCTTVKPANDDHDFVHYQFDYGFYTANFFDVKKVTGSMKPSFVFPSIPGAIFGTPSEDILYFSKLNELKKVDLSLPKDVGHKATLLTQSGIEISPNDTKILRLGTFHINPRTPEMVGGGGFVNTDSNNFMILVFVSKPSRISGTVAFGETEISHNLVFNRSGWSWIEFKNLGENKYQLENFNGNVQSIEFSVLVPMQRLTKRSS